MRAQITTDCVANVSGEFFSGFVVVAVCDAVPCSASIVTSVKHD